MSKKIALGSTSAIEQLLDKEIAEALKHAPHRPAGLKIKKNQQDIAQKKKERRKEINNQLKAEETDLVKQGKRPYSLKKSDKTILELVEQYRDLKKSGKLEKYLTKKRKRNIAKDRGQMPSTS